MQQEIYRKVSAGERISKEEALWLYQKAPLDFLQEQANFIREKLHRQDAYYNINIHFEPTNKCVYACKFCSFYRTPKATEEEGAWDYSFEYLRELLDTHPKGWLTEVHITGGVHKDRGVEYGEDLVAFVKEHSPDIHVKAFTAVEIEYFARKSKISIEETLKRLKDKGLGSLPGGGAEIFNTEVRKTIAGGKAPTHRWLEIHETAHKMGLSSNATMLYGHVESFENRVEHMDILRSLQDKTRGFNSFIPLKYRNENNALSNLPEVTFEDDMRNYCVSRIFLDNIPHLKAYWVMLGIPSAIQSLAFGVDDIDGTVNDTTKIYSMAGGMEIPELSVTQLKELIEGAGRTPVERGSLYETIKR